MSASWCHPSHLELPVFHEHQWSIYCNAVRKQLLCYGCLRKEHAINDFKVHQCGINGCTERHNRLLHSENQIDDENYALNESATTINQIDEVTSFLQIVPVSIQSIGKRLIIFAFLDSGSTVSFIDPSIIKKLQTLQFLWETKTVSTKTEAKLPTLECCPKPQFQFDGSWHHSGSICLWTTKGIRLQDRNFKWTCYCPNWIRMGSQWIHVGRRKKKVCHFAGIEKVKMVERNCSILVGT